jgi:chemotaxis protein MotC
VSWLWGGAAILAVTSGTALAQPVSPPAREPYQLVRTLQLLQDQIAGGSVEAHGAQVSLLAHIADAFLAADAQAWQDRRNARAAVVFLLSGGHPQVIRTLLDRRRLAVDDRLVTGALAYVEGREGDAAELLRDVDARALPASLGGQVSLVKSALVVRQDAKAATVHLDDARLLMPGTLVEEAALRREIFVAGQADDFERFEALATRYMRRYPRSVYAGNFRQRFALALMRFGFAQEERYFPRLAAMLDNLDADSRRTLYLLVSRTAVLRGKSGMARLAAEQAAVLSGPGSREYERARLYGAAARVVTDGYEAGLSDLRAVDRQKLSPRDVEVLDAALALAGHLRKPVGDAKADGPVPPPVPAQLDVRSADKALAQAQQSLGTLNTLLEKQPR